jgi:hypothetical protein
MQGLFLVSWFGSYHDWFEVQSVVQKMYRIFWRAFSYDSQTASPEDIPVAALIRLRRRVGHHVPIRLYPGKKRAELASRWRKVLGNVVE